MERLIAFLRAVNVGARTVKMEALRADFEALGLVRVDSFLASGNVVFDGRVGDLAVLRQRIEARLHATFGFEVHVFLRSASELAAICARRAFDPVAAAAAATHVVGFLAEPPDASSLKRIAAFNNDVDRFHVHGREFYWLSQLRQSESAFSNTAFERALQVRTTLRGMSTLDKLNARISATA